MKKTITLFLACLMLLALCGCGSSAKSADQNGYYDRTYSSAAEEPAMPAPEAAEYAYGGLAMNEDAGEVGPDSSAPEMDPEKIIYSASATVETTDFDASLLQVQELVEKYGGFIESSSLNGSNYYSQARGRSSTRSASFCLRIPSSRFSELMGSLSTLGNVPYSHTYTENISAQYYDVEARLTACRTQETRLLEMMEKAETVSDVIVIEDRLTDLRYQIERLQSSLNSWDRQVSYSTVDLELQEVAVYTPEADPSYGQELWMALTGGLHNAGQFFKDLLLVLVSLLPLLVILGVLALIFVPRIKKRRAAKQAEREAFRAAIRPQTPPEAENKE